MHTHYIVKFCGQGCSLIGKGVLHEEGVLVPQTDEEAYLFTPWMVEIQRSLKRPNAVARMLCRRAITRTWKTAVAVSQGNNLMSDHKNVKRLKQHNINTTALFTIEGVTIEGGQKRRTKTFFKAISPKLTELLDNL